MILCTSNGFFLGMVVQCSSTPVLTPLPQDRLKYYFPIEVLREIEKIYNFQSVYPEIQLHIRILGTGLLYLNVSQCCFTSSQELFR